MKKGLLRFGVTVLAVLALVFAADRVIGRVMDKTLPMISNQGDAAGDENPTVYFYALVDGEEVKADGKLQGYVNWYTVEIPGITPTDGAITVGAHVATAPSAAGPQR